MEIKYLVKGLEKKVEYTLKKNKIRMKGKGGGKYNKNIIYKIFKICNNTIYMKYKKIQNQYWGFSS